MRIQVSKEEFIAATRCAEFIYDSEWLQDGYQNFIENGNDPREHIMYHAAVFLGKSEPLKVDVTEYLKENVSDNEANCPIA
jgi:hypothetical protein